MAVEQPGAVFDKNLIVVVWNFHWVDLKKDLE